jgi:hypothetical protein
VRYVLDDIPAEVTVQRMRGDFAALAPAQQTEVRNRVRRLLAAEQAERRRRPSQLALVAYRVYGIWVDWLPRDAQIPTAITFEALVALAEQAADMRGQL